MALFFAHNNSVYNTVLDFITKKRELPKIFINYSLSFLTLFLFFRLILTNFFLLADYSSAKLATEVFFDLFYTVLKVEFLSENIVLSNK